LTTTVKESETTTEWNDWHHRKWIAKFEKKTSDIETRITKLKTVDSFEIIDLINDNKQQQDDDSDDTNSTQIKDDGFTLNFKKIFSLPMDHWLVNYEKKD
jgi:hypothetical protein